MSEFLKAKKFVRFADYPLIEPKTNIFNIFNAYTTTLYPNSTKELSTGIGLEQTATEAVLVLGTFPNKFNNNLSIKGQILGTGSEMKITLGNYGDNTIEILPHDKICSIYLIKAAGGDPIVVDKLDETLRGEGGFGSTGLK